MLVIMSGTVPKKPAISLIFLPMAAAQTGPVDQTGHGIVRMELDVTWTIRTDLAQQDLTVRRKVEAGRGLVPEHTVSTKTGKAINVLVAPLTV